MRIVRNKEEMEQAFSSTRNEAKNSFSDERTFIEKYIENPRHIEIQLLGDNFGNYLCFGERECSIQRNHQKIIEEAPSPFLDEKTRQKMYKQAIKLAKAVNYHSAGTIEFIVDNDRNFYFLEMNTRLQVEHPVTELITGFDLVELMIRVCAGEKLTMKQSDIKLNGWAFESRVYAEDPSSGFIPSTGQLNTYKEPEKSPNIRIDTGIYEGGEVSMFYDPMIAKLCSYAPTRLEAIEHMKEALSKYVIRGISHNIIFLQAIFSNPRFIAGDISTNFISQEYKDGFSGSTLSDEESTVILAASVYISLANLKRDEQITGQIRSHHRYLGTRWVIRMDDINYPVTVRPIEDGYKIAFNNRRLYISSKWILGNKLFDCIVNGRAYSMQLEYAGTRRLSITFMGRSVNVQVFTPRAAELYKYIKSKPNNTDLSEVLAKISGLVVDVKVAIGDKVTKGQVVMILEAMKMENILVAPKDGIIEQVVCSKGDIVGTGQLLIKIS